MHMSQFQEAFEWWKLNKNIPHVQFKNKKIQIISNRKYFLYEIKLLF